MTFLNAIMLAGLAAAAIPILIHILNRRRAAVVDWGAMQFLAASLASRNRRILIEEILLMGLRCLLIGMLVFALARPRVTTGRLLAGDGKDPQDVAIVVDGSLSMSLLWEGKSNFQRAVEEASHLLKACRKGDAASLILAGATAQAAVPVPLSDLREVSRKLGELSPAGGSMGVLEALHAAILSVQGGENAVKKIVLITDAQRAGWDLGARQRWKFLSEAAASPSLPQRPVVIVRPLPAPPTWRNVCAAGLRLSRAVVGTDRPVKVHVTVANTGAGALTPQRVQLLVGGVLVDEKSVGEIAEGASASVTFGHQFTRPGPHVVEAEVVCKDDLPPDNRTLRVVDVLRELPVLVVAGARSARPLGGDADYLAVALSPPPPKPPADAAPAATQPGESETLSRLVRPTVIAAADIGGVGRFSEYAAVILVDVPRLPASQAEALARYVAAGGGLLVAPGRKADKGFYDNWKAGDQKRLLGCRLSAFKVAPGEDANFVRVAPNTLDHPALKLLADPTVSDLAGAQIRARWLLEADEAEGVSTGAALDTGEPFLLERKWGKGFVLTLSVPLDHEYSDLPLRECYVPLVHEAVYYLAAPSQRPMNLLPGQQIVCPLPPGVGADAKVEVVGPDSRRSWAKLRQRGGRWQATYAVTAAPGLYRVRLPAGGASRPAGAPATSEVPFVVLADPQESSLELLAEADYQRAGEFLPVARAETLSELTAAITGGAPGREIWQYAAVLLAGLLLAEIAATRAITARRKAHLAAPVSFGADQVDVERFRGRAPRPAETEEVPTT